MYPARRVVDRPRCQQRPRPPRTAMAAGFTRVAERRDAATARDYIANTDVAVFTLKDVRTAAELPDASRFHRGGQRPGRVQVPRWPRHWARWHREPSRSASRPNTSGCSRPSNRPSNISAAPVAAPSTLSWICSPISRTRCANSPTAPSSGGNSPDNLRSDLITDHVYSNDPVNPSVLLTPPAGYRARVSVINLSGLPDTNKRNNFIAQLQMALLPGSRSTLRATNRSAQYS